MLNTKFSFSCYYHLHNQSRWLAVSDCWYKHSVSRLCQSSHQNCPTFKTPRTRPIRWSLGKWVIFPTLSPIIRCIICSYFHSDLEQTSGWFSRLWGHPDSEIKPSNLVITQFSTSVRVKCGNDNYSGETAPLHLRLCKATSCLNAGKAAWERPIMVMGSGSAVEVDSILVLVIELDSRSSRWDGK